ncbi:MAG: hypothetical protein HZB16_24285 [Armatimonadetes bacterium]|nr:hypothetical protein [Armatimonadota bacterium]
MTRWRRWPWPLGLLAVVALPWVPYAVVLLNFLPLPAAPNHSLTFFGWYYAVDMQDNARQYVASVVPLCVLLTALLWVARLARTRGGHGAEAAAWLLGAAECVLSPLIRHGTAIVVGLFALTAVGGALSLCLPGDDAWWLVPFAASMLPATVLPIAAATRWNRRQWAQVALVAGLLLLSAQFNRPVIRYAEGRARTALAARAEPLCAALDRYSADHGYAPDSLDDLVPAYLPRVPGTGWSCTPRFEYRVIVARMTWITRRGVNTADFDGTGESMSLYPTFVDSLHEGIANYGVPVAAQLRRRWQLRVSLPDRWMDRELMVAKERWHHQRYGRWTYVAW